MSNEKMSKDQMFEKSYMPFAIRWGKISCIISMLIVYLPALALIVFYDARPDVGVLITGIVGIVSAYSAWYFVDPITAISHSRNAGDVHDLCFRKQ